MRGVLIAAAVLALAGCQSAEQRAASHEARMDGVLRPYLGATLDRFIYEHADMRPTDAYAVGDQREFVFESPPMFLGYSAHGASAARARYCHIFVRATPIDDTPAPSSWRIDSFDWSGYC